MANDEERNWTIQGTEGIGILLKSEDDGKNNCRLFFVNVIMRRAKTNRT